jgi:ribonuclease R
MIEKTSILQFMQTSTARPVSEKELMRGLQIKHDDRPKFKKLLRELIASGDLIEGKKDRVGLPDQMGLVVGYLQVHPNGFGFVVPKTKGESDLYIGKNKLGNAFHGDLVIASIKRKRAGKLNEGNIVRILQRGQSRMIGTYKDQGDYGFVIPEDPRLPYKLYIDEPNALNAKPDQIVVAQILSYNEKHRNPDGQIVQILGFPHIPGMDEKIVIHTYDLPTVFPSIVLEAADSIPDHISEEEIRQRVDLRDQIIFTIDRENARDFDDAVSIERLENANYKLGVHISDVSFYVQEDTPLDQEAYQRGTSVYFPDRAIPMFPERLSSNICCLREGEDHLTLSVFMEFDPTVKLVSYDICPSIIRSKARLTYTSVRQMLKDNDEVLRQRYETLLPSLSLMKELSELLWQKRARRGSLDFDLPEPEIILDVQGRIENIIKAERNLAHRLIEEFMIAANETVASHLSWMQMPSMYRVHDRPDEAKIASLEEFLGTIGLRLQQGAHIHSKDIQRLLTRVEGKPVEHVVNMLTLRAMKQAVYSVNNIGHFGLASTHYTHFTSPIRRYPDLMVHRILRETWQGRGFSEQAVEKRRSYLEQIAEHSSIRERVAMDAEREIVQIKKLRFMRDKVGESFHGVISGITPFGLFVELQEYFVEGMIHITNLHDDYYQYRAETYSLVGEQFRKTYRVGDCVTVQVAHVDVAKRQMDLVICAT